MDKEIGMTFGEIEDCFPEGACDAGEGRGVIVSAQWLHDFARNVCKWQRQKDAAVTLSTFNKLDFEGDTQAQSGGSWTAHMIADAILNQGSKE